MSIHRTAIIEQGASIGAGTAVWSHVHVRSGANVGSGCIVGEKTYIGPGVVVGSRVKLNAFVYLCAGVTIEDGVMVGAASVFTNDRHPRASTPDLRTLLPSELPEGGPTTLVRSGATVGARCTIGPGLTIGRFAMVGMGAVVTRSVPDFHLVVGQPARSVGCACRCGLTVVRFEDEPASTSAGCPGCGRRYVIDGLRVEELDPLGVPTG